VLFSNTAISTTGDELVLILTCCTKVEIYARPKLNQVLLGYNLYHYDCADAVDYAENLPISSVCCASWTVPLANSVYLCNTVFVRCKGVRVDISAVW